MTHPSLTFSDAQSAWKRQPVGLVTAVTARCLSVFTKASDEGRLIELRGKFVVFLLRRSPRKEQSASLFYGAPFEPFIK